MPISSTDLWVDESPITIGEDDEPKWSVELTSSDGSSIVLSGTLTEEIYKNGSGDDLSSTMTDDTASVSGNTLTSSTFSNFVGGNDYVIIWVGTENGLTKTLAKLQVIVQRARDLQ
ncbi:MAG: hypothetical protein GY755_16535 [Chloroflexi bacterium]|nr:hypothetical protein [Chloroflexota bacterium]